MKINNIILVLRTHIILLSSFVTYFFCICYSVSFPIFLYFLFIFYENPYLLEISLKQAYSKNKNVSKYGVGINLNQGTRNTYEYQQCRSLYFTYFGLPVKIWKHVCEQFSQFILLNSSTVVLQHKLANLIIKLNFYKLDWANSAPTYPQTGHHSRHRF